MGQATVDLPDPLEDPQTAPVSSADDLLAQMAGEDIDRMLAASDIPKEEPTAEPIAATERSLSPAPAAQIDDVFAELNAKPESKPVAPVAAPVAKSTSTKKSAEQEIADELDATEAAKHAVIDIEEPNDPLLELDQEPELPVILKPLAWINSPLDRFPDGVRDAIGKIAILTLINAIAVFAYIMIFRRHH